MSESTTPPVSCRDCKHRVASHALDSRCSSPHVDYAGAYIQTEKARAADGACGVTGKFWEQLPRQESVVEVELPQDFSPGLDVATAPTTLPDFCRGLAYAIIGVAVVVGVIYGLSHVLNVGGHWLINYLAAQTR